MVTLKPRRKPLKSQLWFTNYRQTGGPFVVSGLYVSHVVAPTREQAEEFIKTRAIGEVIIGSAKEYRNSSDVVCWRTLRKAPSLERVHYVVFLCSLGGSSTVNDCADVGLLHQVVHYESARSGLTPKSILGVGTKEWIDEQITRRERKYGLNW